MKSLKAAVIVAGSLVAAGAAAPAFAAEPAVQKPPALGGPLQDLTSGRSVGAAGPLERSDALDTENKGSLLHTVKTLTNGVNKTGLTGLLGGLPPKG